MHGRFRESDLFRRVFETVLRRCIQERLVGSEGFAVDASLIKADANRQKGIEGDHGLPAEATGRAIDVYLAVLDDAAFGAATEVTPKFVSPSDPAGALDVRARRPGFLRLLDQLSCRYRERFDLYPSRLGDSAYGSAEMLAWLLCATTIAIAVR